MYQEELVRKRKWLSEQHFLDLMGATNLIPGPNSTEMCIHIGFLHAGWPGLIVARGRLHPARHGDGDRRWRGPTCAWLAAAGRWLLYGIEPVIVSILVNALIGLGRETLNGCLALLGGPRHAALLAGRQPAGAAGRDRPGGDGCGRTCAAGTRTAAFRRVGSRRRMGQAAAHRQDGEDERPAGMNQSHRHGFNVWAGGLKAGLQPA